ncbi:receptor-like protein EIX2 [Humulus lupulus]|uniref:receptor-like protein EIX2 n=1 Tax=Humulus lupulus TaxID=3486 RepID=UPI002B415001|nr:receptor-like protein EIX2 [Humulus lupulus]
MNRFTQTAVFLVILLYSNSGEVRGTSLIRCKQVEREALLKFKDGLDSTPLLSSWGSEEHKRECCNWVGIHCHNKSGHVTKLHLSPSTFGESDDEYYTLPLSGKYISSSLVELQNLRYFQLSHTELNVTFPSFIANLTRLSYLDLSANFMSGKIPPQFGNLSRLQFLDLSSNNLIITNLDWLSSLSSLRQLDLSGSNLSEAKNWIQPIGKLSHLTNLKLSGCSLQTPTPPFLSILNSSTSLSSLDLSLNELSVSSQQWLYSFMPNLLHLDLTGNKLSYLPQDFGDLTPSLTYLDLSSNHIESTIPNTFVNMTSLEYISLSGNLLKGNIPNGFGNMVSLTYLDLSFNQLENSIPNDFGNMTALESIDLTFNNLRGEITRFIVKETQLLSLTELWLQSNQLHGLVPESISSLSNLEILDLSVNSFEGVISEAHFSNLSMLYHLDLSSNKHLQFNVSSDWIPPFTLQKLGLRSCELGTQFPKWLKTQNSLWQIDISSSGISQSIPKWFWNLTTSLSFVNVSNNQISGAIEEFHPSEMRFDDVDLSSNLFHGPVPMFLFRVRTLYLSKNKFSSLNSMCKITYHYLNILDISDNQLIGDLPNCLSKLKDIEYLILSNNKLSGEIPSSIGNLSLIKSLHLSNNNFSGKLPSSMEKCGELQALDVGQNRFMGPIPLWIGTSLQKLVILSFRSNHFDQNMPLNLCQLLHLQVLDLSFNNISGSIPSCIGNLKSMKVNEGLSSIFLRTNTYAFNSTMTDYSEQLFLTWKGTLSRYENTLGLVKVIDLSSNILTGEIPAEIFELNGLVSLNLSRNNLSGKIPTEIGQLVSLDALDLSRNHFSGKIPSSLSKVDRLNTLDLSNNNLSGKIPTGPQLQTRDEAAYVGNPELCGSPLHKKCLDEEEEHQIQVGDHVENEDDEFITMGFFISLALGFIVGFWGVCFTLIFNKSWRYAFFKFLDVENWIKPNRRSVKAKKGTKPPSFMESSTFVEFSSK